MTTWKELVYMVLDALKIHSDDAKFTEEHVLFLISKYRAYILKQAYNKTGINIPNSNYQTLLVRISNHNISNKTIPPIMNISNTSVYQPNEYYSNEITIVPKERMKYVGNNRYLKKIVYCSIDTNNYLNLTGYNLDVSPIEEVEIHAIFENPLDLYDDYESALNEIFPTEDNLVPSILELVLKDLTNGIYKPSDNLNDAQDALSDLAGYLRRNMKSQFQKQVDE